MLLCDVHRGRCEQVDEYLTRLALREVLFTIDYHSFGQFVAGSWSYVRCSDSE
jgi:hypothetical protein